MSGSTPSGSTPPAPGGPSARGAAPADQFQSLLPDPHAEPPAPVPGRWSLSTTSEPGEFVAMGASASFTEADSTITAYGAPSVIRFALQGPGTNDDWDGEFRPPLGDSFAVGSYPDAQRSGFAAMGHPGLAIVGGGHACNEVVGSFVVDALTWDPNGALRSVVIRFEQHCEGQTQALRGTFSFTAA